MVIQSLSPSEIYFIQQGVENNLRNDGRTRLDYRPFELDIGEISHAVGSSRIILADTHILVGIKADISAPDPLTPNKGSLTFSVDCCPSASPEYEGKGADYINIELAKQLERVMKDSNSMDLGGLCIMPGKYCWNLYIDAIVLDSGGNLFDALSIGVRAALANTRLPTIRITQGEYSTVDFEVSDDPEAMQSLDIDGVPINVTLTTIGNQFVVDCSGEEEQCMDARMTIGVNKRGNICGIQKGGVAGIDAHTINQMILAAKQVGSEILKTMDNVLKDHHIATK
ncbi:hypothetical protein DFA_10935 [Cavenderia fasciculata]|uniref:Ribosomal RNA-processing protein 42 n=1 Tax=Cavenderia fasciculata TaxID=261658 RepID=F4QBT9_CACFS|nr:uncharacterized protein DFA_10935 [Cavenderia fasciculata]EGG14677.1 hypothetical protein DFA_10935 [Cavenderia fasciculata]|eukprot:XP_004351185.1 hypothetical protein DFA_10935 [Cavenderia fasciculata]